jgi:hypothetical protein
MLKLERLRDGKVEKVFDKPQPPLETSKTATLGIVANKFCSKPAAVSSEKTACEAAMVKLHGLESKVQADVDKNALQCKQVKSYLEQIEEIRKTTQKNACAISGLDAYMQDIRTADCIK